MPDADGVLHEFHFRSLLFGDQLSLEGFELTGNEEDFAGSRAFLKRLKASIALTLT
ncbi:DUF7686 domain-containing protein [Paraburkholderia franconis]|uniref:DUF7686 domain-containing protein n=1 Tax=Paraburkholderia franconis TaxID=2654983 RepID=UPI0038994CFB